MNGTDRAALYARLPLVVADDWWLELARGSPDGRVLELGAGTGRLTAGLVAAGAEVTAVEHDPAMAEQLRIRLAAVRVEQRDAATADGDAVGLVVLASSLVNEQPDAATRRALLAAAAARVAPGGRLALHLLNPWWLVRLPPRSRGRLVPLDGGDEVEVSVEAGRLDAVSSRRQAILRYRFADGTELVDPVDAAVVTADDCAADLIAAGLRVTGWYGGQPPDDPHEQEPAWHLLAERPDVGRR